MKKQKSYQDELGKLYLVPTPIGNLEDMTVRGVKILKEADLIASEDTRNTQKLLNHFKIEVAQKSLHEHNYKQRIPEILKLLKKGQTIAQVSDAGMPSISDPGQELVAACIQEGIAVISLPGPTAGLTALIASGLNVQPNYFYGFLPRRKKDQKAELKQLATIKATMIFYESPYRLKNTISNMNEVFNPQRNAVICRELTKIHEEYLRGTLAELKEYLTENTLKGECCLLVEGQLEQEVDRSLPQVPLKEQVEQFIATGLSPNDAIKEVAKQNKLKKQKVYNAYHELNK
ncbi:MAG: 16S rRNA (cytidine(1402)-2'-O)-methyltransferase [Tetragenococcus halophilus]|uniref:Ribosomal RNA small subunit methyltransferase I n=2 Tax=Tetragenococcus halophilus TaxID=51669 RepID=A0A2H6CT61_TETHA|nr:16S rRNA (cytidine(1402)-2'-O)-methyltransferase [Tetragenococcus halophilus]AOF49437.1 16S rRNA methyltransferase [Tetragenococcus halophilus]MCF1601331.1 16S rRNA (cytidine(1402)-2'-O)-methyltransferase [Tetragenococcus halophilus]MCF1674751.1 16S rRNA (cytidine(1402)-2'-O)-methyltransferase [Tetragenococcus halophilus]MCO8283850.1 16S rRNA (cytidine(1402)-2'-O)-methyltransferase [Tetragenococcus halophilus]MCO8288028.1 16S rRNA (cytidine(1402)-2'-O)-methyltransferase [Tetragenococcus hal